jgi:hypothetical protein
MVIHTYNSIYSRGKEDWSSQASPSKKEDPILSNKLCILVHNRHPNYIIGIGRRTTVQGHPTQKLWDPIWRITKSKMAGYIAQVVEHLPSKLKALGSNSSTATKWVSSTGSAAGVSYQWSVCNLQLLGVTQHGASAEHTGKCRGLIFPKRHCNRSTWGIGHREGNFCTFLGTLS